MISENPKIMDWSVEQWHNFYQALFHRGTPKTTIAVIHKDNIPIKIIDSLGRSRPNLMDLFTKDQSMPDLIKTIYHRMDVDVVYAISYPAIRNIFSEFSRIIDFEDNYLKQLFTLKDAIVNEMGQGILRYPPGLHWLVKLEYNTVKKIFRAAPDNTLIMLTIFGKEEIWTNWIIGIEGGSINLITTIDTLKPRFHSITNWKREYKHITTAVKEQFGKKPIAFFMDNETFIDLIKTKSKFRFFLDALSTKKIISKSLPIRYRIMIFLRRIFGRRSN
ncbi:MAG: hypothetical protein C00003105_01758 [ANME-2 cluster archaeon HR1]|jgi:hypothetical protein|nr:MAG: hypothetical protein C00003105_01758 [ANME-2 cluster archaeon HR1]